MSSPEECEAVRQKNLRNKHRADVLDREITELMGHLNAANYQFLLMVAEMEEVGPWGEWGLSGCAQFLNWRCGIGMNAAREKVRVAKALGQLPLISERFSQGALSYSNVRAMTRVATPENEDYLLMIAAHGTAAHVEKLVRCYRGVQRTAERERTAAQRVDRDLSYRYDDDGMLVIKIKLAPASGAVVMKALELAVDSLREADHESVGETVPDEVGYVSAVMLDIAEGDHQTISRRRADGFVQLAESYLESGPRSLGSAERYQVVVHVSAESLQTGGPGRAELEHGANLDIETVRRLSCDGSVVVVAEDREGNPLDIGRKSRAIPPSIHRALRSRDQGCRFPGCTHKHFVDAHHIEHWANGGETKLTNLVQLCRAHHRMVHEGGATVSVVDGQLRFTLADGRVLAPGAAAPPKPARIDAIVSMNQMLGLSIDERTAVSYVTDRRMDYDLGVMGLLQKDGALEWQPPARQG